MGVRIYVYPGLDAATGRRVGLEDIRPNKEVKPLLDFLVGKRYVRALDGLPEEQLRVRSDDVLGWLRSGDARWESYVEPEVVKAIKEGGLFRYPGSPD
jgi:hypothetical protein